MPSLISENAKKFNKAQTTTTKSLISENAKKFGGEPTTTTGQRAIADIKNIAQSIYNPRILLPGLWRFIYDPYKELMTTGVGKELSEAGGGLGAIPASLLAAIGAIPKALLEPPIKTTAQFAFEPEKKATEYAEHPVAAPLQDILGAYIAGGAVKGIIGGAAKAGMTPIEAAIKAPGGRISAAGKYIEPPKTGILKPQVIKALQKTEAGRNIIERLGLTPEQQSLAELTRTYYQKLRRTRVVEGESELSNILKKLEPEEKKKFTGITEGVIPTSELQAQKLKEALLGAKAKPGQLSLLEQYSLEVPKAAKIKAAKIKTYNVESGSNLAKALELWRNLSAEQWQYIKGKNVPIETTTLKTVTIPEALAKQWGIDTKKVKLRSYVEAEKAKWIPLEKYTGRSMEELQSLGIDTPTYFPHIEKFEFPTRPSTAYTGISAGKPGFLKKRTGFMGYMREADVVIPLHRKAFVRWKLTREFIDDIMDTFGKPFKRDEELLPGYAEYKPQDIIPPGMTAEEMQAFGTPLLKEKIQMPTGIITELNTWVKTPGHVEQFLRSYVDPATNVWRVSVLSLSPRWLLNNFFGNIILNTLGDVGISGYIEAFVKFRQASKLAKTEGISFQSALAKLGVPPEVAQGVFFGEMEAASATRLARVLQTVGKPAMKANTWIETLGRTAHYLDKIGKGLSEKEAINSVNEFLFNYLAGSPGSRSFARRIFPFWTWNKNITRLAFTYPLKHPMRAALLAKADIIGTEIYEDNLRNMGIDPTLIPDYLKHSYMLPWSDENGKPFYISLRGIDPMGDVTSFVSNPMASINPILKVGIEGVTGVNLFTLRQFTAPYEVTKEGKTVSKKPSVWRLIGRNFPQITMIDDIFRPYSKYETGDIMLQKTGEPYYTKDKLLTVLKILGLNITPREIEQIYESSKAAEERAKISQENYMKKLNLYKGLYK
jgi:hypothetical protein